MTSRPAVIVLAAGKGTRFPGAEHKLLQQLGGVTVVTGRALALQPTDDGRSVVTREQYFLVTLQHALDQPQVQTLIGLLKSEAWRAQLNTIPGYAAEGSGEVLSLRRVLPWWSYRKPKRAAP